MNCPPAIAKIILEILTQGILRARAAGWAGDANRCALESDHIHNLPRLLSDYSPAGLKYYWEAERPAFMSQISAEELKFWEPWWQRLSEHVGTPQGSSVCR